MASFAQGPSSAFRKKAIGSCLPDLAAERSSVRLQRVKAFCHVRHHPVIAFVVPYPFEILDLTGPVSVFERAARQWRALLFDPDLVHAIETALSRQKAEWPSPTPANTLTMWDRSTPSL